MLKIMYVNIRSLNKNFNEFKNKVLKNNYDIIGVQEIWNPKNINIRNYRVHIKKRNYKCGGGLCIYIKNSLKCELIDTSILELDLKKNFK